MHIKQQANGNWRVIVQADGVKKTAVAASRRLAMARGAELMLELGHQTTGEEMTFEDLLELYIKDAGLATTTAEDYRCVMRKVPSWMKAWRVSAVSTMMVDQGYKRLLADGWSADRVRTLHSMTSGSFKIAARYGWVRTNPASDAQQPPKPYRPMNVPPPAAVLGILARADENPALGCALRVSATTGVRRGELCGLQWDDFDEARGELVIQRSISTTTIDPYEVTSGKTEGKGHRVVGLGLPTTAALRAHRTRSKALAMERGLPVADWIFTIDGVNPWRTDYVTLAFGRIRNELGVKVKLKDFRHFVATQLLGANVDIRTVSGRLGHARTSTTLDMYAAFLPARDREAAETMERILGG